MSTDVLTNLDRPETTHPTIEPAQHTSAKVVGFLYLFLMATAMFAQFYARGSLIVHGDAVQTANNIAASERLLRISTATDLITVAGGVILLWGLYVVLKPINRNLALLAAFWQLVYFCILAVITLNDVAVLVLLNGADWVRALDTKQLAALVYTLMRVQGAGYFMAIMFYALGSTVFAWLWFKSRYIPRGLAALGVFSNFVAAIVTLVSLVFPGFAAVVKLAYFGAPVFIFEIGLGLWLLIKGIQAPPRALPPVEDSPRRAAA